uniref:Uncharacterized protein n=1 Tax=Oryza rufipogon TaxID=4529 RepID=A0A0E0N7P3_ORYRU
MSCQCQSNIWTYLKSEHWASTAVCVDAEDLTTQPASLVLLLLEAEPWNSLACPSVLTGNGPGDVASSHKAAGNSKRARATLQPGLATISSP